MTGSPQLATCLIIGATGGIGSELSRRLAVGGWKPALAARSEEKLRSLAAELDAEWINIDATSFEQIDRAFEAFPNITAVVNLVGSIMLKPAHATSEKDLQDTLDLNLKTAFGVVRAAGRSFRQRGGSVVLTSTCAASMGLANHEAIAAAKAGVEGLVRAAAATYAPSRIRVNAVAPGLVRTPLSARITGSEPALKTSLAMHPLGRIGEPADVARAIEFLLDPAANWITGQVIGVDGGLARVRSR
jgi:NAD(P)-dependent dehydrogenase (short-subunit alcohol dehydrogenase family)